MIPPSTPPGDGRDERAELGAQPEDDGHRRGDVVGRGGVDPGRGHHPDVLGVGRRGRTADRGGEHGAETVGGDGAAHHRVEVGLGHRGDGLDVAGVLRDQRDHGRQDEQDEGEAEAGQVPADHLGAVRADDRLRREAEPGGVAHARTS